MFTAHRRTPGDGIRQAARATTIAARLARDLPPYLHRRLTLAEARQRVAHQLQRREARFLAAVDRLVYGNADSPYLLLLRYAGCERGDFHMLVAQEGVEGALRLLARQGVYVSYDELKGRREAVRGSARFHFTSRDFDSPLRRWHYFEATGGSGGQAVVVGRTLPYVTDIAAFVALAFEAHGIHNPHNLFWIGGSPTWAFVHLKLGHAVDAWLHPVGPLPLVARAGIQYARLLAATAGRRIPPPELCDVQDPEAIVRRIPALRRDGRVVLVNAAVSSAVRIATAATSMGVSLEGTVLHARSEPLTEARLRAIARSGARTFADYASVELSMMGASCAQGTAPDDLHVALHRHAIIERERPIFEDGPLVSSLHVTTLSLNAPLIALNVELGDSARLEERECGCPLGALGLRTHISEIRSFEKLSTEGISFARSEIVRILEEALPRQFGGTAVDYQLVEDEATDGTTQLVLRIDPNVGPLDEASVRAALLAELGRGSMVDRYQAALIQRAQSVVVQRRPPLTTGAGKVFPFRVNRARSVAAL